MLKVFGAIQVAFDHRLEPGAKTTRAEPKAPPLVLGFFNTSVTPTSTSAAPRLVVQYSNGTVCDVTKKPRQVKLVFECAETTHPALLRVIEEQTCRFD